MTTAVDHLKPVSFFRYMVTSFLMSLITTVRQKRIILAAVIALLPVVLPLAVAFFDAGRFAQPGGPVFTRIVEYLYLRAIVPLLAIFFGCMLIGEDVETNTMPFILTRPISRFAWVVGKFLAYLVVASAMLVSALVLTFAACTVLSDFGFSGSNLILLEHYAALGIFGLIAYGAFCTFLGATVKRPIVVAVIFIIPWQRIALTMPGYMELFTIEKYINELLPVLPTAREQLKVRLGDVTIVKEAIPVSGPVAILTLLVISLVFLYLARLALTMREFTQGRTG